MKWVLLVLLILLLLLLIIFLTNLKVTIDFMHMKDNDHLKVKFRAWFGLIRYTINVPLIKVDDDSPSIVLKQEQEEKKSTKQYTANGILAGLKDTKMIVEHVAGLHTIIRQFLKRVSITKLQWDTQLGIGDAAITGIITGMGWSIKGTIIGIVSQYMILRSYPHISITPSFQQSLSQTKFLCMVQFRIGYAMLAGIRLVKFWRGGLPRFKSTPLSMLSDNKSKKSLKS